MVTKASYKVIQGRSVKLYDLVTINKITYITYFKWYKQQMFMKIESSKRIKRRPLGNKKFSW